MKTLIRSFKLRILLAAIAAVALWPLSMAASIVTLGLALLVYPTGGMTGVFPTPGGSSVSQIVGVAGADAQQVLWELEIIQSAFQQSPFSDNMVGKMGSGKPIIEHTSTKTVAGQAIVINTVDSLGAPMIQGNAVRVSTSGNPTGEQIKPGDFRLSTSIGFFNAEIDNTGLTQTIVGGQWSKLTQTLLARRLAKQQNDDRTVCLRNSATSVNTKYPNGKTLDTLSSTDSFSPSVIKGSSSLAKDLGTIPMNINPNPDKPGSMTPPPIHRFLQFLTDVGARPIKGDPEYLQGLSYAGDRGKDNPIFTGEYQEWDNNIVYPWVNVRHGGYGSVGSALQPEALLGVAIVAKSTSTTVGTLTGGGNSTAAAVVPLRNYFEFFTLFPYVPISGTFGTAGPGSSGGAVPLTWNPRGTTVGYIGAIDKATGLVSVFSYTANTGNTLTGVQRLGSTATGDYVTTLTGSSIAWNTGAFTTAADGNGYLGVSEGVLTSGSLMFELNAKGVPLCYGFCLGEMALVEGYARVPVNGGESFKPMINRVDYAYPYGQAFGRGIEVAWGVSCFQRPDGLTPNYVFSAFSREQSGWPQIA